MSIAMNDTQKPPVGPALHMQHAAAWSYCALE
jgi:hypothetical protein